MPHDAVPRIPAVADPTPEQQELLAKTVVATSSEPPNLFRTLAHHPLLMRRVNALGGLFMAHSSIEPRDREVLILRVAARAGSAYEFAQHRELGRRAGVTDAQIALLTGEAAGLSAAVSASDRALVSLADELLDGHDVSDAAWAQVRTELGWTDAQLLEALTLVGFYAMLAGVLNAVRVPLDAAVAGS